MASLSRSRDHQFPMVPRRPSKVPLEKSVRDDDAEAGQHRLIRTLHRMRGASPNAGSGSQLEVARQAGHELAARFAPAPRLGGDGGREIAANRPQRRIGDMRVGTGPKNFLQFHEFFLRLRPLGAFSDGLERHDCDALFPGADPSSTGSAPIEPKSLPVAQFSAKTSDSRRSSRSAFRTPSRSPFFIDARISSIL